MTNRSYLELAEKERFLIPKKVGGDLSVVIAYPNRYWVAMSNLGFQTVYRILQSVPRFSVERAYVSGERNEELKTFESKARLSSATILAISVSFESDYPRVLRLIREAGLDPLTCRESEPKNKSLPGASSRPFILGGGAALSLNPEPLSNFFDAILIGEAEEALCEFSEEYIACRENRCDSDETLFRLAQIEGLYVPLFYEPSYREDGSLSNISARAGVPKRVKRRIVKNLDASPCHTVIQTSETEFRSMFLVETGRGCEMGCRFCACSALHRPVRKRSRDVLESAISLGDDSSEGVGFVGASVSGHPDIVPLVRRTAQEGKRVGLSSLMTQRVSSELSAALVEGLSKSVALAPETGSEELRFRIGKRVRDEEILTAVSVLVESGVRTLKLYFMVGLPEESIEDVEKIGDFVLRLQQRALSCAAVCKGAAVAPSLSVSVNTFIPKPWTAFQRASFQDLGEAKRRIQIVRRAIRVIPNTEMKAESPKDSYFQTLLSRGDRRVGDLLIEMFARGEEPHWIIKNRAKELVNSTPKPDFFVYRSIDEDEVLAWEVVDMGVERSYLEREFGRAMKQ